jgi:hypothetical protein
MIAGECELYSFLFLILLFVTHSSIFSLTPQGNYTAAQELVREQGASSSRFKFFIQQTLWAPGELKREIEVTSPSLPPSPSAPVRLFIPHDITPPHPSPPSLPPPLPLRTRSGIPLR